MKLPLPEAVKRGVIWLNLIKIFRPKSNEDMQFSERFHNPYRFCSFHVKIINYEHIVWSACDGTINGKVFRISIFSLSLNRVLNEVLVFKEWHRVSVILSFILDGNLTRDWP